MTGPSLSYAGTQTLDYEASSAPSFEISFDIYAEDEDGKIPLDVLEAETIVTVTDVDENPLA